ncbi:MAG: signal peptidase II [Pirellulaceae bacterium]|nr:signal peptidase II [Pirellulaceae bacterium]
MNGSSLNSPNVDLAPGNDAAGLAVAQTTQACRAGCGCLRWNRLSAVVVFLLLAGSGLAADLGTKSYVFANYWPYHQHPNDWPITHEPHWLIDGVFGIQTSTNGGALFGMMQGFQVVFVTLSLLALLGLLLWLFGFGAWRDRMLLCCLGLITGGILGNLYDRLGLWHDARTPADFHNHVRDWIHFRLEGIPYFDPWPNFNIADSLLVVGVLLMLVHNFFFVGKQEE